MRRNEAMHPCPLSALVLVTLRLQWLGKLAKTFMIFIFIRLIELAVERGREGGWAEAQTGFSTYYEDRAHKYSKQEPNIVSKRVIVNMKSVKLSGYLEA